MGGDLDDPDVRDGHLAVFHTRTRAVWLAIPPWRLWARAHPVARGHPASRLPEGGASRERQGGNRCDARRPGPEAARESLSERSALATRLPGCRGAQLRPGPYTWWTLAVGPGGNPRRRRAR